ncbi:PREDICTED: rho guanine nucleotide exchange factor 11-like, partial [Calidris pugnax]|uniref:rho guanine nucleotide exchange factor 11-like n=1 Tax=Calidris pugnax TaxID=198806 RepID=UPI00071E5104
MVGGWLHPAIPSLTSPPPPLTPGRLSSLSSLGDSSSERRSPGHHRQPSDSSETTGLVQRCVIIQKDQHGFGFTVSGDRVVLVQSVRPGEGGGGQETPRGSPPSPPQSHIPWEKRWEKGGFLPGVSLRHRPRVNGTMVTNSSHLEVVKLIKCERHDGDQQLSPGGGEVNQRFYEAYSRNPASTVEEQIEGARRRVSQLQLKILQETGGSMDSGRLWSDSGLRVVEGRLSMDSQDGDSGLESGTERFPSVSEISLNRNSVLSDHGLDSPRTSPVITARLFQHHRRQGSDTPFAPAAEQGSDRPGRPLIIGPEEDCDPGDFNGGEGAFLFLLFFRGRRLTQPFISRLLNLPLPPPPLSPQLFYLCAEVCQQVPPKDSRGLGRDIWNIFLDRSAPLRVKVAEQLLAEIETRLRNGDDVRAALFEAQEMVMPEIQEQIQDYRTKRTMGLGSLYGENDLLDLDGDPQKERQVAEKQLAQLGDILSKYEEDRSSPMAFALSTYMNHTGIRSREPRVAGTSEKSQALPDKDKWLPFFPKTKKSSSTKKDKEAMEDKKRNPILKYIGKPKISSQSTFHVPLSPVEVKPGNVRNIIQHFENNQHQESQEPGAQRLSTGSFPEDLLESDSSRAEVRLGRSESLKGREEMKKSRKAENVPRSRSDVDMDAAAEATRLHQSASSSASSLSTRWEMPPPPG